MCILILYVWHVEHTMLELNLQKPSTGLYISTFTESVVHRYLKRKRLSRSPPLFFSLPEVFLFCFGAKLPSRALDLTPCYGTASPTDKIRARETTDGHSRCR